MVLSRLHIHVVHEVVAVMLLPRPLVEEFVQVVYSLVIHGGIIYEQNLDELLAELYT